MVLTILFAIATVSSVSYGASGPIAEWIVPRLQSQIMGGVTVGNWAWFPSSEHSWKSDWDRTQLLTPVKASLKMEYAVW